VKISKKRILNKIFKTNQASIFSPCCIIEVPFVGTTAKTIFKHNCLLILIGNWANEGNEDINSINIARSSPVLLDGSFSRHSRTLSRNS